MLVEVEKVGQYRKNKNIFCALKQHAESFKLVEENLH